MSLPNNWDGNQILASLTADDAAGIMRHLRPVRLEVRTCLEAANRPISTVYFPLRGLLSVAATSSNHHHKAEVGVIGSEGMTGSAIALGAKTSPFHTYVQMEGDGLSLEAPELMRLVAERVSVRCAVLRYVHVFAVQMAEAALANASGKVPHRLARWLLMAHDRAEGDELRLTHEFLSVMLGVRRAGVTTALHDLASRGLISITRKSIVIKNRAGLEVTSDGLYGMAERELARLLVPLADPKRDAVK
jgi:CRP-like cAMP-binding protein